MKGDQTMPASKQDWLQQGLKTLEHQGLPGLTIDNLAGELGLTKGSFYHHFKNGSDFEEQLVAFWAEQYLSTATIPLPEGGDPLALLDTIMAEAFAPSTGPEIAIRAWAYQDERVRAYVERVDIVRRQFLQQVFEHLTADHAQANRMADMLFSMLIGSLTALPRLPVERIIALYVEFKRLYGLEA
jgi:AcrR family transcriptional regulator